MNQSEFKAGLEKAREKVNNVHWKIQTSGSWGATCVPYLNATHVIHLLNKAFDAWSDDYELKEHVKEMRKGKATNSKGEEYEYEYEYENYVVECTITMTVNDKEIIRKGFGEGSDMKSAESDSLKRAAKKFNVGEFLFDLGKFYFGKDNIVKDGKYWHPTDRNGKPLKYTEQLTDYINSYKKLSTKVEEQETSTTTPNKQEEPRLTKKSSSNPTDKPPKDEPKDKKALFRELEQEIQGNENIDGTIISLFSDRSDKGKKYRSLVFNNIIGVDNFTDVTPEGLQAIILNIRSNDEETLKKLDETANEFLKSL